MLSNNAQSNAYVTLYKAVRCCEVGINNQRKAWQTMASKHTCSNNVQKAVVRVTIELSGAFLREQNSA